MIVNPVLRGFHPDPCICRAEGKYYLITSTFEWLPGVSLYESEDLVHWKARGGLLEGLNLRGIPDSAGVWAPALSYDNGLFYLVYTISRQIDGSFKDVENYVVTARRIEGPWSEPVFINASGFDPSMFHENGRHYVLNPQWDSRLLPGHRKFNGLLLQEFDMEKGMIGEAKVVFSGSSTGGTEGPHLMKKDGFYYIIAAEGGTGRHHSICVARSEKLWGPYEISPYHPLITSWEKDTILKKSGHGNFVETPDGEWYMTHLCARYLDRKDVCVLGRETALQKLEWIDGWPRMVQGNCVPLVEVEAPVNKSGDTMCGEGKLKENRTGFEYRTHFPAEADLGAEEWLWLRRPLKEMICFQYNGLFLKGGDSLTSLFNQSLIARRWKNFSFEAGTTVLFQPYHYAQTAGLACYYNTKVFYYLYVGYDEVKRARMVNILCRDGEVFSEPLEGNYEYLKEKKSHVRLMVRVSQEEMQFYFAEGDGEYKEVGPILDASVLSDEHAPGWAYTGAMVGITAVDTFNKDTGAVFSEFYQKEMEK